MMKFSKEEMCIRVAVIELPLKRGCVNVSGPYLHTVIGFAILCKVCDGKMFLAEVLLGKRRWWSYTIISKTIDMCR